MTRDDPTPAPEEVTGPLAVRQLLELLSRSTAPLTIHRTGAEAAMLDGWLEDISVPSGKIRLLRLLPATLPVPGSRLRVLGRVEGVEVRFELTVDRSEEVHGSSDAICSFALPVRAERLQRRSTYRVRARQVGHLGAVARRLDGSERFYPVLDLSGDGLALLVAEGQPPSPGELWRHCRLEIERDHPIPCDLVVRALTTPPEVQGTRVGCAFDRPSAEALRSIERYVIDIQRSTRTRRDA